MSIIAVNIDVKVTEKHIKNGEHFSYNKDPIALALIDHFKTGDVDVSVTQLRVGKRKFATPERVALFITGFDDGEVCDPFVIRIRREYPSVERTRKKRKTKENYADIY